MLADVCAVLGVTAFQNAAKSLSQDEKGLQTMQTPGGLQKLRVVSRAGLGVTVFQNATKNLNPDEKGLASFQTPGGLQNLRVISRQSAQLGVLEPKADV